MLIVGWENRRQELEAYAQENGNADAPLNTPLGRWCLHSHRSLTMGVLLGLLLGALLGLWPFKTPVPPEVGSTVRGALIETVEQAETVKTKYWPTVGFTPSGAQVGGACALILTGMFLSSAIGLLGSAREGEESSNPAVT